MVKFDLGCSESLLDSLPAETLHVQLHPSECGQRSDRGVPAGWAAAVWGVFPMTGLRTDQPPSGISFSDSRVNSLVGRAGRGGIVYLNNPHVPRRCIKHSCTGPGNISDAE